MKRSAVGVMNGNFRGGMYYEYRKQIEADALKSVTEKKAVVCKVCGGDVEAVPMYPELCYDCYVKSVTPPAPHPVDQAQAVEREIDETLSRTVAESDGRNPAEDKQIKGYFGKVKVTTSPEWRKRHLHQTQEEIDEAGELRKAWFGKR